ncbi:MAG: hypothetical protein JXB10_11655 [Pirellulales bacterium]|nr:hypothetical protein [Pirellulales bacterium]
MLFDDEASVAVPFWHEGNKAAETFREIWTYLEIISREAGYLIYDPQLERVINPTADFEEALACYTKVTCQIHQLLPTEGKESRPWWKFW